MAAKNNIQFNTWELEREKFSNFVVDLRAKTLKTEEKIIKATEKKLKNEEIKLNKKFKKVNSRPKINPNLLKQSTSRSSIFSRTIVWPKFKFPSKPRLKLAFSLKHLRFRRSSPWQKIVASEQRIFSSLPPLKKLQHRSWFLSKRSREVAEELSNANQKVVWYRSLFSFSLALILIIVPLKLLSYFEFLDLSGLENKITGQAQLALNNLMAATDSVSQFNFKQADSEFKQASDNFISAQEELNKISDSLLSLASLSNDPKLKLAAESKKFLNAGALTAQLGRNLVLASDSLFNGDKNNFSATLNNFTSYGTAAVTDAKNLEKELAKIKVTNLPVAYQEKFTDLNKQVSLLAASLDNFVSAASRLKEVLGLSRDKRYLLVFQNNAELRASGGFLGSYALVDIRDGKIRNLEVPGGGSYDTEAGMKFQVVAPEPLWLVNPLWHFWDANWWPDWPKTAKNLMWFYEKSDGPSVDGVISVTPTVVERLLEITGPIDLTKEYGLTIDANNFWETVQKIVEQKNLAKTNPEAISHLPTSSEPIKSLIPLKQNLEINADNKPKKIIGDLMAKILEILPSKLTKENLGKILSLFEANLAEKQILFYFTDPNLQAEVGLRNWAGEIRSADHDYLMVINTNIAGQKSDREMTERIEQLSEVGEDGSIINTVKIYRTHTGVKREALVGVRNVDWLRVYVPAGSELLASDGWRIPAAEYFNEQPEAGWLKNPLLKNEEEAIIDPSTKTKIYQESGKTVFANWVMVDPGETVVVTLKYRLPLNFFTLSRPIENNWLKRLNEFLNPDESELLPYSLLVQKQPGAKPSEFSSRLSLPNNLRIFWRYPDNLLGTKGWEAKTLLDSDQYYSILLEQK